MNSNNILRSAVFRNRIGASKQTLFPTQISRRAFTSSRRGLQQQSSQSTPQTGKPNSTFKDGISVYRPFGAPFLKVFLGAIFTYQVIYYLWMKLETSEKKLLKNEEIKELEKEAKRLAASTKS